MLGAIIAGGMSRLFGSDKAMARIDRVALLDHVHAALKAQVDEVVLCGRTWLDWSAYPGYARPRAGSTGRHGCGSVIREPERFRCCPDRSGGYLSAANGPWRIAWGWAGLLRRPVSDRALASIAMHYIARTSCQWPPVRQVMDQCFPLSTGGRRKSQLEKYTRCHRSTRWA